MIISYERLTWVSKKCIRNNVKMKWSTGKTTNSFSIHCATSNPIWISCITPREVAPISIAVFSVNLIRNLVHIPFWFLTIVWPLGISLIPISLLSWLKHRNNRRNIIDSVNKYTKYINIVSSYDIKLLDDFSYSVNVRSKQS